MIGIILTAGLEKNPVRATRMMGQCTGLWWTMNCSLCAFLSCPVHFGYHILQISSTVQTTLMYQELLITSLKMKYIEYACKASWSMITTGHVEITFFFRKSIFNVVFWMFIFNVDFRCWFSMSFLTMNFTVYFLLLFFDYIFS